MKKYYLLLLLMCTIIVFAFDKIQGYDKVFSTSGFTIYTYTKKFSNIHFVEKDGRCLMVDAGLPEGSKDILKFLKKNNIDPRHIEYLILTHAHPDHAGNAAYFQKELGVKVIAGRGDLQIIKSGGYDKELCPIGLQGAIIQRTIASQRFNPFEPDILVDGEMDLSSIGWEGRLASYKSHTEGSLVFFIDDVAFVGDLIKGENLNKQKPAFHIFMCDLDENLNDIEAIAQQEAVKTWFLGHGGPLERENISTFVNKKRKKYE